MKKIYDKLNVTPALISAYENGKRNPKLATLNKISAALGVPFGILDSSFETSPPQRLKHLRISAGLSLEELSERISVSIDTITAWENGNKAIRHDDLEKLLAVYHLHVSDIISEFQTGEWQGVFKPLLVPDSAYLDLDHTENDLIPDSYCVYYDPKTDLYYISYPDSFVLKIDYDEYSKFIDSSQAFIGYQLEQLKKKYINKSKAEN